MRNQLIAVPDLKGCTGMVTWWKLHGDLDLEQLTARWLQLELDSDDLPSAPTDHVALKRALHSIFGDSKTQQLQAIPGKAGCYALMDVTYDETDLEGIKDPTFKVRFKAWLENGVVKTSAQAAEHRKSIFTRMNEMQSKLTANDVSVWLSRYVRKVQAIPLRDGGGVYFVPQSHVESWRAIKALLASVSGHVIYDMPAMNTEGAVEAVLDSLKEEINDSVARLREEVERNEIGKRAWETRQQHCREMLEKVQTYEGVLGQQISDLTDTINALEAQVVAKALEAA